MEPSTHLSVKQHCYTKKRSVERIVLLSGVMCLGWAVLELWRRSKCNLRVIIPNHLGVSGWKVLIVMGRDQELNCRW